MANNGIKVDGKKPPRLMPSVTLFQSEINGGSENQSSLFVGETHLFAIG
jgi:hypothetical protein